MAQVASFVEDVVGAPAVLFANGLSGAHAIRIAAERPELVACLALIAPTGDRSLNRPQDAARERIFDVFANPVASELFTGFRVDEDVSEAWPATRQPALLVWGTAPGFSSYEDAEDFVLARPDAQPVLLRDAALLPNEECSAAFNRVLIAFLA